MIAVILVASVTGMWARIGSVLRWASLPAVELFAQAGASVVRATGRSSACVSPNDLRANQERMASLAIDVSRFRALEDENRALRAQANFLFTSGYDSVGARVIGRDLRHEQAYLMIDRGGNDHIEIGQAVVADQGIFIGKISTITEQVATVELLTDPRSRVAAAFNDDRRLSGVVEGRGNGAAVLTYIPASEHVKKDQIVVTSGTEDKLPPHLPLGIVNAVEGKTTDPFLNAIIEPLIPFDQVTFVSVLRPSVLRPNAASREP